MSGICIYAEQFGGVVEPSAAELVTAAQACAAGGETVTLLVLGEEPDALAAQLAFPNAQVAAVQTPLSAFQDDALAAAAAEALRRLDPAIVLIPASRTARALFSRVAVRLDAGLTADCSELFLNDAGEFSQRKSAFGASGMCVCVEVGGPKLATVQQGVYAPCPPCGVTPPVRVLPVAAAESGVEVLETVESTEESIAGAERILSLGRGALEGEACALAAAYAERLGAVIGGTRPLVDNGTIPFERQIGQTGCTVHPRVCLYLGVSGAIQHTEGVRDAKLTIAVNKDPQAAVFSCADYGAVGELEPILRALLAQGS